MRRFSELKVGDKVTFRYQESAVVQVRKPGDVTPASSATQGITRSAGAKPGGTMAQQVTASVTVEAIDAAVPSITVKTDDGRHVTYHVEDKKNLEGVKAGDRLDITLTRALMVSVADGKAARNPTRNRRISANRREQLYVVLASRVCGAAAGYDADALQQTQHGTMNL